MIMIMIMIIVIPSCPLIIKLCNIITGRPARSAAMPVLRVLSGPKMGFSPRRFAPRAKFHVYRSRNVGIQPPKLSKFGIFAINLLFRGDSLAYFYEILSVCMRLYVT